MSYCKVEGVVQQLVGHAAANAIRARLGAAAWSLMERGAAYQHNCRPQWRPAGKHGPPISRIELLTGVRPDVSAMLGYVGQHGWAHDYSGKSNAYRDTATPVIYVHPSTECSAQVVFNIARAKLDLVHSISLSTEGDTTSLLLAQSELCKPRGSHGSPSPSDYESRIHALLRTTSHHEYTIVAHDPLTGLPDRLYTLEPHIGPDGELLMLPTQDTPPMPAEPPPHVLWSSKTTEHDVTFLTPASTTDMAQELATDLPPASQLPDGAALTYRMNPKNAGSSHTRYCHYERARTIAEYWHLTSAASIARDMALADLRYDILHHHVMVQLPATVLMIRAEQSSVDTEIEVLLAHATGAAALPLCSHSEAMAVIGTYQLEALRLDNLEERPSAPAPDSYHHGLLGDPRRYTTRFRRNSSTARDGVVADYPEPSSADAQALEVPRFDDTFAFTPATMMFASSDPMQDIPTSVMSAMKRTDYDIPFGWKPAIAKEVRRVVGFDAIHPASMQDYHNAVEKYGQHRVSIG